MIFKRDQEAYVEMMKRHANEQEAALAADKTGDGYILDMFRYELGNHEYGYTMDPSDTLDVLGYTLEDIEADPRLKHGLERAMREIKAADQ